MNFSDKKNMLCNVRSSLIFQYIFCSAGKIELGWIGSTIKQLVRKRSFTSAFLEWVNITNCLYKNYVIHVKM